MARKVQKVTGLVGRQRNSDELKMLGSLGMRFARLGGGCKD